MKTTIVKPDGTRITIESDDKELVESTIRKIQNDIKKANEIKKIEPIEKIEM